MSDPNKQPADKTLCEKCFEWVDFTMRVHYPHLEDRYICIKCFKEILGE